MKAVNFVTPEHEHEFEAALGLPEALPAGERILWQGRPDTWRLACDALHIRAVMAYFGVLVGWSVISLAYDGASLREVLISCARMLSLAGLGIGLLSLIALLMARSTAYTLTNQRIVMRLGIVLSVTFNLPFSRISHVDLRSANTAAGSPQGDIALTLAGPDRIAYLHLWPHVRAWRLRQPQPLLRSLPDAAPVARMLVEALKQAQASAAAAPQALPQRAVRQPSMARPAHAA